MDENAIIFTLENLNDEPWTGNQQSHDFPPNEGTREGISPMLLSYGYGDERDLLHFQGYNIGFSTLVNSKPVEIDGGGELNVEEYVDSSKRVDMDDGASGSDL